MGADSLRTMSIAFMFMGAAIFYFAPNAFDPLFAMSPLIGIPHEAVVEYLLTYHNNYVMPEEIVKPRQKGGVFTKEELSKYDGTPESPGLYLAILGEVFDVSKGAQHYKPGSSYAFFTGRDASRAYVTGNFEEVENSDDVSDLDVQSLSALNDWLSFYRDEYPLIGKLIGRYYDSKGKPTDALQQVQEKIKSGQDNKYLEDQEKTVFPACNSEWSKEKGSRVWCTKKSGGVDRDWVGVPRMLYKPKKDPRCVCVRDTGPPSNKPDLVDHKDLGDLEHQNLHVYPDCPIKATSCNVKHA